LGVKARQGGHLPRRMAAMVMAPPVGGWAMLVAVGWWRWAADAGLVMG
jgi:hypothetical protein